MNNYRVRIEIEVDPDAPWLECVGDNRETILELFKDLVYDVDDMEIKEIEVDIL